MGDMPKRPGGFGNGVWGDTGVSPFQCKIWTKEESMKIVFLEADSLGEDMKLDHFFEIGEVVVYGKTTVEQVPERIAEADAVIVNKLPMNKETLSGAGFLKYIGLTATGVNNIDFDYTNKRGITVTNVAGYSTEVVAQHTFAMMFYLLEHLRYYDDYVKSGKYIKSESFCHIDSIHRACRKDMGDYRARCDWKEGGRACHGIWL